MNTIKALTQILDHFFNRLGYIPIVSTLSGFVRLWVYGVIQGVVGFVFMTAALFIAILHYLAKHRKQQEAFIGYARFNARQILEGRLNAGRGIVELVPFFGNATCYFYDKMMAGSGLA